MSGVTVQTMMASKFAGGDAALLERDLRRFRSHVGRSHFRRGDVPLGDADALQDPFIRGVDQLLQILIGQQSGRRIAA